MTIKELLLQELEYKKFYQANWNTDCNLCFEIIEENAEFIFMGDKQKVCLNCIENMEDLIDEKL